jgi:hypothetical protein
MKRADHFQVQLQAQFPDINLNNPDTHNDPNRRDVELVRLKEFWIGLHLLIFLLGVVLAVLCLYRELIPLLSKIGFPF